MKETRFSNGFLKNIFRGKKTIFDPKMADHLNFGSTSRIFFQSNERDQEVHKNYILFTKKKFRSKFLHKNGTSSLF